MNAVLIVAAGSSRRMGFDKLQADLAGRPVLRRSIEAFECHPDVHAIILVVSEHLIDAVDQWKRHYGYEKILAIVRGGAERHLSVAEGLKHLPHGTEFVAVHDGARPLVSSQLISKCFEKARHSQAASAAHRVVETLQRASDEGSLMEQVDRSHLWAMETPQVFALSLLQKAYHKLQSENLLVTDEVSAVLNLGHSVQVVENTTPNLKITYPEDLDLATAWIIKQEHDHSPERCPPDLIH